MKFVKSIAIKKFKPQIRFLNEMKDVLYDQKWAKTAPNFEVYYMYRGVKKKNGLRYDITIIPPRMLGREFPKTKGHRHQGNFPELIQVLEGRAFYFAQKGKGKSVKECYLIEAKKGDFVIVPPGYHHLTISPSRKKLKMANWISKKCQNIYDLFEKRQGACYYYTKKGWIKNKNYAKIPKLDFKKPLNPVRKAKLLKALEALKFSNGVKSKPKNLDFLKKG